MTKGCPRSSSSANGFVRAASVALATNCRRSNSTCTSPVKAQVGTIRPAPLPSASRPLSLDASMPPFAVEEKRLPSPKKCDCGCCMPIDAQFCRSCGRKCSTTCNCSNGPVCSSPVALFCRCCGLKISEAVLDARAKAAMAAARKGVSQIRTHDYGAHHPLKGSPKNSPQNRLGSCVDAFVQSPNLVSANRPSIAGCSATIDAAFARAVVSRPAVTEAIQRGLCTGRWCERDQLEKLPLVEAFEKVVTQQGKDIEGAYAKIDIAGTGYVDCSMFEKGLEALGFFASPLPHVQRIEDLFERLCDAVQAEQGDQARDIDPGSSRATSKKSASSRASSKSITRSRQGTKTSSTQDEDEVAYNGRILSVEAILKFVPTDEMLLAAEARRVERRALQPLTHRRSVAKSRRRAVPIPSVTAASSPPACRLDDDDVSVPPSPSEKLFERHRAFKQKLRDVRHAGAVGRSIISKCGLPSGDAPMNSLMCERVQTAKLSRKAAGHIQGCGQSRQQLVEIQRMLASVMSPSPAEQHRELLQKFVRGNRTTRDFDFEATMGSNGDSGIRSKSMG
eukprot:TRINITY_DN63506_c0_g1_i1.p1 TRINITY_DN63506_c0_g1~~TRINITY_DN63506_c0_g1_i1.p1  ORF type:complete len:623 (-),score=77.86 TRINITY_DN63506_c0_g1_i1:213-1901(-)